MAVWPDKAGESVTSSNVFSEDGIFKVISQSSGTFADALSEGGRLKLFLHRV